MSQPVRPRHAIVAGLVRAAALGLAVALALAWSPAVSAPAADATSGAARAAGAASARYVIQLADAPLAKLAAAISPPAASVQSAQDSEEAARADGSRVGAIWLGAEAAAAHTTVLRAAQQRFETALAASVPGALPQQRYRVAFNGMTVRLTPEEAERVRALPGVVSVTPEEAFVPLLDASLPQIAAPEAWADARVGGRAGAGRGVRIAVIDTGITADHPMFDDAGFTAPPGYPRASLTIGDRVVPYDVAETDLYTNRKVIVARVYANPESYDPARPPTPLADGSGGLHGAHVAGIAAGSPTGAPAGSGTRQLSGVAPGAYLMAYKLTYAYTPEMLKAIDDAVADGADVINASWGTAAMNVVDPQHHPISVAFRNATAAGVVVVAAAGNSGANGESTLGGPFQMIDSVITVANVHTGRTFGTFVVAEDDGLPSSLERHPASQFDMGNAWDLIEGSAIESDLCDAIDLLQVRGKVVLLPVSAVCDNPIVELPIELPEPLRFVQSLLMARLAGALAVVMVGPDGAETSQRELILTGLDVAVGMGGEAAAQYQLPVTALIRGDDAVALAEWSRAHPSLRAELHHEALAIDDPTLADRLDVTSSRGPAPLGAGTMAKPDLAAPGSPILSAATDEEGAPAGFVAAGGTSMAAPHVAGAAAVLRRAWPGWGPADIKAALLVTADPSVTTEGDASNGAGADRAAAPTTAQGAGRLNLARALDPGLLVMPPSLSLTAAGSGSTPAVTLRLVDTRRQPFDDVTYRVRHEPGTTGEVVTPVVDATVIVPEAGQTDLQVAFRLAGAVPGLYDGRLALESDEHTVRVFYQVRVPPAGKDVLLLNVLSSAIDAVDPFSALQGPQFRDTADYSAFWTRALDEAGLTYDLWTVGAGQHASTPPPSALAGYGLVLLAAGDGNAPLDALGPGMTALQMYLLGGGRLVASGRNWDHGPPDAMDMASMQTSGAMYFLSRYFAGFERTAADAAPPASIAAPAGSPYEVLFEGRSLALATQPGDESAGNADRIDYGRPLAALATSGASAMQPPFDNGFAAPVTVDALLPYMRLALAGSGGGATPGAGTMTAVTADATLEQPRRADFIPWRAAFAGFPFEAAVATGPSGMSRADLLAKLHRWAVEPADVALRIEGASVADESGAVRLRAFASSPSGVTVVRWRWDDGMGGPPRMGDGDELAARFEAPGHYTVRAEATTAGGHTYVTSARVRVGGLYVPSVVRHAPVGGG